MNQHTLEIKELKASIDGKKILEGVDLSIRSGEIHAIMGPNGSGKSTLAYALAGHPRYKLDSGKAILDGKDILEMPVHERSKEGLFLAFQYPQEIPGLNMGHFIFTMAKAKDSSISPMQFKKRLDEAVKSLGFDKRFLERNLNVGFSGGEKKRAEVLQLILANPKFAILDETDSGLDIDSLRAVCEGINKMRSPAFGAVIITHYPRMLEYLKPDFIHIFSKGKIIKSGGPELAKIIEENGYKVFGISQEESDEGVVR